MVVMKFAPVTLLFLLLLLLRSNLDAQTLVHTGFDSMPSTENCGSAIPAGSAVMMVKAGVGNGVGGGAAGQQRSGGGGVSGRRWRRRRRHARHYIAHISSIMRPLLGALLLF
jgi:hypothetical protein